MGMTQESRTNKAETEAPKPSFRITARREDARYDFSTGSTYAHSLTIENLSSKTGTPRVIDNIRKGDWFFNNMMRLLSKLKELGPGPHDAEALSFLIEKRGDEEGKPLPDFAQDLADTLHSYLPELFPSYDLNVNYDDPMKDWKLIGTVTLEEIAELNWDPPTKQLATSPATIPTEPTTARLQAERDELEQQIQQLLSAPLPEELPSTEPTRPRRPTKAEKPLATGAVTQPDIVSDEPTAAEPEMLQEPLPKDLTQFDHAIITVNGIPYYLKLDPELRESYLMARVIYFLTEPHEDIIGEIPERGFLPKSEKGNLSHITDKTMRIITQPIRALGITDKHKLNTLLSRPHIAVSAGPLDPESIKTMGRLLPPGTKIDKRPPKPVIRLPEDPSEKRVEEARLALRALTDSSRLDAKTAHRIAHNMITLTRTDEGIAALMQVLQEERQDFDAIYTQFNEKASLILGNTAYRIAVAAYGVDTLRDVPGRDQARGPRVVLTSGGRGREKPPVRPADTLSSWMVIPPPIGITRNE